MKKAKKEPATESITGVNKPSLSKEEQERLLEFEKNIETGQMNYMVVGKALAGILDGALYKVIETNFDRYCVVRWEFSGSHARRLIEAYELGHKLQLTGKFSTEKLPRNENQARLVRDLRKRQDHWVSGWKKVLEKAAERNERVTAHLIEEVLGGEKKTSSDSKPAKKTPKNGVSKALKLIDDAEKEIESKSLEDWIKLLADLKKMLQEA
jgi:hypothetical protein